MASEAHLSAATTLSENCGRLFFGSFFFSVNCVQPCSQGRACLWDASINGIWLLLKSSENWCVCLLAFKTLGPPTFFLLCIWRGVGIQRAGVSLFSSKPTISCCFCCVAGGAGRGVTAVIYCLRESVRLASLSFWSGTTASLIVLL